MSKFLQRIDTEPTKFAIEIHLTKVEISLIQQCRISVILKRGKCFLSIHILDFLSIYSAEVFKRPQKFFWSCFVNFFLQKFFKLILRKKILPPCLASEEISFLQLKLR